MSAETLGEELLREVEEEDLHDVSKYIYIIIHPGAELGLDFKRLIIKFSF